MLQAALPILLPQLINLIVPEITKAIRNPSVPLESADPPVAAREVATQIAEKIANNPQAVVPPKPALKSSTVHGLIIGALGLLGSVAGVTVAPEDAELLVSLVGQLVTGVGLVWAWIGRRKAVQPLGA